MKEIILNKRKNGMIVLLITIVLHLAALAAVIYGGIQMDAGKSSVIFIIGIVYLCLGWIVLPGLKVLKPQEALVLTLFGKYVGTLKGDGFYFVNPFCVGVNPAAKTQLNQSGDVKTTFATVSAQGAVTAEMPSKKLSLKIMTLNNNRQKINDCLTPLKLVLLLHGELLIPLRLYLTLITLKNIFLFSVILLLEI